MDTSNHFNGQCDCGNISFTIILPGLLCNYEARVCDCDFCSQRSIAYLSDPNGLIKMKWKNPPNLLKQGSNQAHFIECEKCKSIVAVTFKKRVGAININCLNKKEDVLKLVPVSPKLLSSEQKTSRWQSQWMPIRFD